MKSTSFISHASVVGMVAFATALIACQPSPPAGVLLITVDTLRADHLGAYGYAHDTSPHLDALAKESVLFRNAVAPAPWTLPSVATLFTSLYPTVHGASRPTKMAIESKKAAFTPNTKLADDFVTIAEILRDQGFATAAFVRGAYPSSVYGLNQGFDYFEENQAYGIRFSTNRLLDWLDRESPDRFFIYLHTIEVHAPYRPIAPSKRQLAPLPEEERNALVSAARQEAFRYRKFDRNPEYKGGIKGSIRNLHQLMGLGERANRADRERLVQLYDRGISYTDHWLGELVASLRERGLLDQMLVIVTSDHGEEFWDHGGLDHGHSYYDELLRVPLLLRLPGGVQGIEVEQQVGLIDVLPTILDVAGVDPESGIQGRSLRPLLSGGELPTRPYFAQSNHKTAGIAMRTEQWKLIRGRTGQLQLYDRWKDPNELDNVCESERKVCERLLGELQAWQADAQARREALQLSEAPAANPDDETIESLRALGYIE